MKKRLILILLTVATVVALLFLLGTTANADAYGDFTYTDNVDGTATVTGYTGEGGYVEIFSSFGGKTVTAIGDEAFANNSVITSISIPASVTSIGDSVFKNCSNLESITVLPANDDYTSESGVLYNKDKTTLICYPSKKTGSHFTVPSTVTGISEYAFQYCESLRSIQIP